MFLLPLFIGFIWLKQKASIPLYDTHVGMIIVYTAFFTPVAIFFMRSFFLAIPRDLEEAAMVDGCTPFKAFVKIVLPNAAPGLVATFVYAFLFSWDELLFVTNLTQHTAETIPIGIRTFIGNYQERTAQLMAAGVVTTLPVLIAFFATQRWLVQGPYRGRGEGMTHHRRSSRARSRPAPGPSRRTSASAWPWPRTRSRAPSTRTAAAQSIWDTFCRAPGRGRRRRHRRRRLRPLPPLARGPRPDGLARASSPTASRSPGRACSRTAAARSTAPAWTSTGAWPRACASAASSRSRRSTTGTCRRRGRRSAAGRRATPPSGSPSTPG